MVLGRRFPDAVANLAVVRSQPSLRFFRANARHSITWRREGPQTFACKFPRQFVFECWVYHRLRRVEWSALSNLA